MSPTVVITAGLMIRDVSETESWQICICYNGHHSLVEPTEAHANSFLDGYEAVLSFFFFFFCSRDLNNWWCWVQAETEFGCCCCFFFPLVAGASDHNPRAFSISNHDDSIGQQRDCETAVVRLIFLVVLLLLCHLDVNLMLLANDSLCLNINQRNVSFYLPPEGNSQDICFLVMA